MESMTFEVRILVSRPSYTTECDYDADLSNEDYEAIGGSSSWKEIPQEIYDRVYESIICKITDDLLDDGTLEDDEDVTDHFEIYIVHPNEDNDEFEDWDEDDGEDDGEGK